MISFFFQFLSVVYIYFLLLFKSKLFIAFTALFSFFFSFFCFVTFLFLFQNIYNWKTYFINYKLPINEKKNLLPPNLPVPLFTENQHLLTTSSAYLYPPPTQRLNLIKSQIVLIFKTFSTCCHFLLYIICFFSLFIEIFSSIF